MKRTIRRGQICTGQGSPHIHFYPVLDIQKKIFLICSVEKDLLVQGLIVFDHLQMHNYKHLHVETLQWLVQSGLLTMQQTKEWQEVTTNLFLQT